MSIWQAMVMGLVQGLGEFLPISSSAHLVLTPWLFNWPDPGLSFDVALHIGTLIAVVAYFWRDWWVLLVKGLTSPREQEGKIFWYLVVACIPGALFGLVLEHLAETVFRTPLLVALMLFLMGVFLYWSDRAGKKTKTFAQITFWDSLFIGFSQALAIIPGVSRSGITMSAGLLAGLSREATARFSFLLSAPIIFGAGLVQLKDIPVGQMDAAFWVGVLTSMVTGFLAIKFLLHYLKRGSFLIFAWYRFLLAAAVVITTFWRA
ncbi:MAG: undecaprenyl-diphosphatase [Clostridia bacterium]|nr:undecaprenyl-diphosphatase [Clostridia bacterium]